MLEVKLPRLGVTMQRGTVSNWLVEEGEWVDKGDFLFELESEKSTVEIEAQESGVLKKIFLPEGEEVPVNTVIAIIAGENEEVDVSAYTESLSSKEEVAATEQAVINPEEKNKSNKKNTGGKIVPKARKLAKELGISIEEVIGTGKGGLITVEDVKNASGSNSSISIKEKIALNHIKRSMSANMTDSWNNIPQFTQMVSVNMENALKVKKELDNISLNDIIIKTVGNAVKSYSIVNSRLENDEITVFDEVNVSVAVNSKDGLVVPVVRNVENKSVTDISSEIKSLNEKANNNKLTTEDFTDGTITVSNLGSLGVETGTPIINPPQSTILFAGAVQNKPVVSAQNEIIVAPIMTLSICYDHRFIDGVTGAQFTNKVKQAFENLTSEDLK
ncbi:dihydrolipoamide acetyltransferase family protein [Thalassobacillus sp. C254]|uniref:dihydrolipoamide acetyltransferase family protein n=1 Tax=Thalassobacillus sp. C254 TaxID=1225341 RepID=UPI0006D23712|nr:dihydrolipoamide acetyltransferase family protein [Thalassobacillus sp. C254]